MVFIVKVLAIQYTATVRVLPHSVHRNNFGIRNFSFRIQKPVPLHTHITDIPQMPQVMKVLYVNHNMVICSECPLPLVTMATHWKWFENDTPKFRKHTDENQINLLLSTKKRLQLLDGSFDFSLAITAAQNNLKFSAIFFFRYSCQ